MISRPQQPSFNCQLWGNYGFCVSRRMKEYVMSKENFMIVVLRHSRTWLILLPCLGLLTTASLTYGQSSEASDKYLKRGVSRLVKNDYDNAISDFDNALDGISAPLSPTFIFHTEERTRDLMYMTNSAARFS